MSKSYPYISSGGPVVAIIQHLKRSFPTVVDASTLKKLAIAPNNESFVLTILRFLGILDRESKKIDAAGKVFLHHDEATFQKAFSGLVKTAYHELFSLHGDAAWELDTDGLISFFRQSAESSQIVGQRQANTFKTLAAISGYASVKIPRTKQARFPDKSSTRPKEANKKNNSPATPQDLAVSKSEENNMESHQVNPFGLSVRIEVNLPASADQETYDRIFKSIRKNLINKGES